MDVISPVPPKDRAVEGLAWYIRNAHLKAGDRLPPERELCQSFGVSRTALRSAIGVLISSNVLESIQGSGTYVCPRKPINIFQEVYSFSDSIRRAGMEPSSRVLDAVLLVADLDLAAKLGVKPGSTVFSLQRVRYADGAPVSLEHSFVNERICPGIVRYDFSNSSLYEILQNSFGIRVEHGTDRISITTLREDEAAILGREVGEPAFYQRGVQTMSDGVPVEYCKAVLMPERYRFGSNTGSDAVKEKVGTAWLME